MLLPPPRPMIKSIPARRATATQRSTSAVVGIFPHLVVDGDVQASGLQKSNGARGVTRGDDALVGDEQDVAGAKIARQFSHALDGIRPKTTRVRG